MLYGDDIAYVHHSGFGDFADEAAPGLIERLHAAGLHDGLVVDLACGSGIWARRLIGAGYRVLGIDVSDAMIQLARATAPEARFMVGSAHAVELPPCAAVTALGEGLTYIGGPDDVLNLDPLLRRVHDALVDGGLFIFDVVERSTQDSMAYSSTRSGDDWIIETVVAEDPHARLLTRAITLKRTVDGSVRQTNEMHYLRTFDRAELETMLASLGYSVDVTRRYGTRELPPKRLGFIARKTGAGPDPDRWGAPLQ